MPKPIDEDRARRRELLEQKRAARRAAKQVAARHAQQESDSVGNGSHASNKTSLNENALNLRNSPCLLTLLPEDAMQVIFSLLPAADLGRLLLTSKTLNNLLPEARVPFIVSRLHNTLLSNPNCVGYTDLCQDEAEARRIVDEALRAGGDTGRIVARGKYAKKVSNEFVSYARFLEESVSGYSMLSSGNPRDPIMLPRFVQGRIASASPEHSLCRVGGDGERSGAGGSGVASWGVGKRGQLGHGKREDERLPRMLMGGLGYGIRIVQVSAGGGLVRVAHSLLLTSTGRVLSFGTGQYGALGHGYSSGKQLPDSLRPQYIEALSGIRCIAVAAGELHSAVVTSDGDVYTWGDGFCGQLGHGDKRPQLSPKQVTQGGLEDECVAAVSCGCRHTVAVTEDGEAFSWGLGHYGCLGRSFTAFDHDADAAMAAFADEENGEVRAPDADFDPNAEPQDEPRNAAAELQAHLDLIANLSLDDSSDQCIPKPVEALNSVRVVGSSAGHRHTLLLDSCGALYSCGTGSAGCLGHGDTVRHMYPVRISAFDEENLRIKQMSAGVDMSMAVTTTGEVWAWGKTDGGRIGLGVANSQVLLPRRVPLVDHDGNASKAVDVECGYVHSLIIGLSGTVHLCGGVGVEGDADGQDQTRNSAPTAGEPTQVADFNIWHRVPEPKLYEKKERWKKFGKYEVKGRSKMLNETYEHNF